MNYYRRSEFDKALAEALKFNYPELHLDPLMRAPALARLGRHTEAKAAIRQLLELVPDFTARGRGIIFSYVKVDDLVDKIVEGQREAGLADLE